MDAAPLRLCRASATLAAAVVLSLIQVQAEETPPAWQELSPLAIPQTPRASQHESGGMIESARLYGNLNKYAYYFTDLLVGSPNPQRTSVIVDTGSRIAGFPCRGCQHCGLHIDEPFDLNRSLSARWLECGSDCIQGCVDGHCTYKETYSEGSSIIGRWFDDVVELGESLNKNPRVHARLGCHNWVDKLFYTQRANGIMGLAPASDKAGIDSAPTVLQDIFRDHAHISTRVFSLCLATWGGRLSVGGYSTVYHEGDVHWTRMHASKYYFTFPDALALVPPGESDASSSRSAVGVALMHSDFGVTIVDSGTTYTYFPGPLFSNLVSSLTKYCDEHDGCGATREGNECWRLHDPDPFKGPQQFPTIRFHFQGGATVNWSPDGYLHERGARGVWCQTFMENSLYQTVLGISWMLHKDIIFDLANGKLGVARASCPEHHRGEDEAQEAAMQRKFERAAPEEIIKEVRGPGSTERSQLLYAGGMVLACAMAALLAVSALRRKRVPGLAAFSTRLRVEEHAGEAEAEAEGEIGVQE